MTEMANGATGDTEVVEKEAIADKTDDGEERLGSANKSGCCVLREGLVRYRGNACW